MKDLTGRIVGFDFAKLSATMLGKQPVLNGMGGHAGAADQWDEALLASMYDESAHRFLEFWGPRWK